MSTYDYVTISSGSTTPTYSIEGTWGVVVDTKLE